ncbi:hypothetical protein BKA63DRAFT_118644 [Paraphoma chrysanthemicola]|nr:hypothetical protein BKA63DRAFT_118644 [Paraphoma chrysanthemicola]
MMVPHILRLPVELHLQVLNQLDLNDNINITAVNRYFRTIVKPPSHGDYLIAEADDWAKQKRLYACSGCSNFRRFEEFADAMRKGKYTRAGALANVRLCLQCGIVRGLYTPGMFVMIYGQTRTLCKVCRTFTDRVSPRLSCDRCTPNCPSAPSPTEFVVDQCSRDPRTLRSARVFLDSTHMDGLFENGATFDLS